MTEYTSGFERWWKLYPSHRRRDKLKCFLLWQKRHLEQRTSELCEKLQADVANDPAWQPDYKGKQFIPLTHTYLNGGRYDDDAPKPRRMSARAIPEANEPERDVSWEERMLNRLWLYYCSVAGGLGEKTTDVDAQEKNVEAALSIRRELMRDWVPAFREDAESGESGRGDVARELADMFLTRLDAAYGKRLKERVWALAYRAA